jgi:hypothetical protein
MRIVAHDALCLGIMLFRIDAGDFRPNVIFVREKGMTADTESPAAIDVQPDGIFRMIIIGAMAVFTAYGTMGGVLDVIIFVLMTFSTDFGGLVLHPVCLPLRLVGLAVPAIHVTPLVNAKIIRHKQCSSKQDSTDYYEDYE